MTSIAFIMPTFNRANLIKESIQTIVPQMRPQDTLTVVDDGSTDDTETIVREIGCDIQYIKQENSGKSVALNRALAATESDYVWICDDDDLLCPNIVDALVEAIESDDVDIVFGRYTRFYVEDGKQVDIGTGYWPDLSKGTVNRHILEDVFVHHNATLARRSAYEAAGLFDPVMLRSQDYAMYVKLALTCKFKFIDELVFLQRQHKGVRGPKAQQHDANKSDSVWQKFDKLIFQDFQTDVPLSYFEAFFTNGSKAEIRRVALLQRGCMYGRHGLWNLAIEDFAAATAFATASKLNPIEAEICRRMMAGKYGLSGILAEDIITKLRNLRKMSGYGRNLVMQMANGVIWRLRGQDDTAKTDAWGFLKKFGGQRFGLSLVKQRLAPDYALSSLSERTDFQKLDSPR